MATSIGNSTTPVYVDTHGVPKACDKSLHRKTTVRVEDLGDASSPVIAEIKVNGTTTYYIHNDPK